MSCGQSVSLHTRSQNSLIYLAMPPLALADGFDVISHLVVGQWVVASGLLASEMSMMCPHKAVEISQVWSILIVEGDHPMHCCPFQGQGNDSHLATLHR